MTIYSTFTGKDLTAIEAEFAARVTVISSWPLPK